MVVGETHHFRKPPYQLIVNWWFRALVVWIPGISISERGGVSLESQNHQFNSGPKVGRTTNSTYFGVKISQ